MNSNKRLDKNNELDFSSFSSEELEDFQKFLKFQKLSKLFDEERLKQIEQKKEVLIPTSVFNVKLGALETICKYMKENLSLSNKKISEILERNSKSIWKTYEDSKKKHPNKLVMKETSYFVPARVFADNTFSVLENLVSYLKENYGLSYKEISIILHRDERTVWTAYNRGLKKR